MYHVYKTGGMISVHDIQIEAADMACIFTVLQH